MNFLTIDSGTTNTRVCLWRNDAVIGADSVAVGVRDTAISGSRDALHNAVRDSVARTLNNAGVRPDQIGLTLAAGMITSALGLFEVPHVPAPASLDDLAQHMIAHDFPDLIGQPVWFIPGVRNAVPVVTLANCDSMDMMRGEEVEVIGLLARLRISAATLFILPGSHTKLVHVDAAGSIRACATTLTGELLQTVSTNTILAPSLGSAFADSFDAALVSAGAASANRTGLGRTCFSVRILDQFNAAERNARANFLLGAVLASDILTLKNSTALQADPAMPIVIAGGGVLQEALALLIAQDPHFTGPVTLVDAAQQQYLSGFGAARVAVARGLLPSNFN
jgi:2-dehydro-3-deoxygalactonokinase